MGNYVSCTVSGPAGKQSSRCAKVIFPGGDVRTFSAPTMAAELMLETPNFFLVNSRSLKIGRKFYALSADEELDIGNVYVMFPMQRLNTVVAASDMAAMFFVAKRASGGSMRRILPEIVCADEDKLKNVVCDDYGSSVNIKSSADKLKLDEIEGYSTVEINHRLSMTRSRKPMLETIVEETDHRRRLGRRMSLHL